MLINSLSKTLCRLHSLVIKQAFARKVRVPAKPSDQQLPQTIDQAQASKLKWLQKRQEAILKSNKREIREEDEDLERQIFRLMDQGKTDQQILKELSKKKKTQSSDKEEPQMLNISQQQQELFRGFFGFTKSIDVSKTIEYKQQMMLNHIQKEAQQQAATRATPKKSKKKKSEEMLDEEQGLSVPEQFLEDAENFKNEQLKYLSSLVQNRKEGGKYLKQRTQKGYKRGAKEISTEVKVDDRPQVTGIVPVQSLSEKMGRMITNYQQAEKSKNDLDFIQKGELDLKKSELNSNLYLREDETKLIEDTVSKNSHLVHKRRISSLEKMLQQQGLPMDIQSIKHIEKQTLMESKKNLEELEIFRKRLQRRERLKKIKELSRKINQEQFSDKHEDKQIYAPLDFNPKKHKLNFGLPNFEKINQINKNYAKSMFSPQSKKVNHLEMHTSHNIIEWMWYQLIDGATNRLSPVFDKIVVSDIYLNDSNTTVTIKWRLGNRIRPHQIVECEDKDKRVQEVQSTLDKMTQYISGKMCQDLKLRFGPLIKFKYWEQSPKAAQAKQEMLAEMPKIIKAKLISDTQKGHIPQKMKQKDLNMLLSTMQSSLEQRIDGINFNRADEDLQKKKKKERNNKNPDGSRKRGTKKRNPAEQFWNQL